MQGAACPRGSEGLHVIAGEEARFLAPDALVPAVRVPPHDKEEVAGLEGELVVLLPRVGVEGHHCQRRERGAMEPGRASAGAGGRERTTASLAVPALASAGAELGPRCRGCGQGLNQKPHDKELGGALGSAAPFSR